MSLRRFGPPPAWFYDVYDAITQSLPLGPWPSIRAQPLYQRYRYRLVHEAIKESRFRIAEKSKAMGVIDLGRM